MGRNGNGLAALVVGRGEGKGEVRLGWVEGCVIMRLGKEGWWSWRGMDDLEWDQMGGKGEDKGWKGFEEGKGWIDDDNRECQGGGRCGGRRKGMIE